MPSRESSAARTYRADDLALASHLSWLRGYLSETDPDVVPKVDMAIRREQELRDRYYDVLADALADLSYDRETISGG